MGEKGSAGKAGVMIRKAFLRGSRLGNTLLVEAARALAWDAEIVKG